MPRAIGMAAMTNPYARAGALTYRYGPTAYRAAGRIARFAYRRWRGRKRKKPHHPKNARKRIGKPVGTSTAKSKIIVNTGLASKNTRTQYIIDLSEVPKSDAIDNRVRNIINVRGFKFCMFVHNREDIPLTFNIAVISPKAQTGVDTVDFFRGQGAKQRGIDFATFNTSLEFKCLPINTDKYNILRHKRYTLGAAGGEVNPQDWKCDRRCTYMEFMWYTKLNRQWQYDSTTDNGPESGRVFLVYWADTWGTDGGAAPIVNAYAVMEKHLLYFKEPKM